MKKNINEFNKIFNMNSKFINIPMKFEVSDTKLINRNKIQIETSII